MDLVWGFLERINGLDGIIIGISFVCYFVIYKANWVLYKIGAAEARSLGGKGENQLQIKSNYIINSFPLQADMLYLEPQVAVPGFVYSDFSVKKIVEHVLIKHAPTVSMCIFINL